MPHIHFIGIGGAGIGPCAQLAYQAGYEVSGSDLVNSSYIEYLKEQGIKDIEINDKGPSLQKINEEHPIDWIVYTSSLTIGNPNPRVLSEAKELGIRASKRDEFINQIAKDHDLKMIAIAGTHGKTTTTAMVVWLFKELDKKVSYILPAKVSFGEMAHLDKESQFLVIEADEFDRNFLSFEPHLSLISGVSWDHHEIYKTREEYKDAFNEFIQQSNKTLIWGEDAQYLGVNGSSLSILDENDPNIDELKLDGLYNRRDAVLAVKALQEVADEPEDKIISKVNDFPGLSRRMEEIAPNLYSDYAHTPEKIRAAIDVAKDMTKDTKQKIIVVYEPLTNRRQAYILDTYKDCFNGANKIYWLDSYLAREDPDARIISPEELISHLSNKEIAEPAKRDDKLKDIINHHLSNGDMIIGIAGGGGDSLDDWLRENFTAFS